MMLGKRFQVAKNWLKNLPKEGVKIWGAQSYDFWFCRFENHEFAKNKPEWWVTGGFTQT